MPGVLQVLLFCCSFTPVHAQIVCTQSSYEAYRGSPFMENTPTGRLLQGFTPNPTAPTIKTVVVVNGFTFTVYDEESGKVSTYLTGPGLALLCPGFLGPAKPHLDAKNPQSSCSAKAPARRRWTYS